MVAGSVPIAWQSSFKFNAKGYPDSPKWMKKTANGLWHGNAMGGGGWGLNQKNTCMFDFGCERPSTMVRNPTYGVLSRNQFCREFRARWGGVAKKWRMMTRGRGGGTTPPKIDDVIYEQPLIFLLQLFVWMFFCRPSGIHFKRHWCLF